MKTISDYTLYCTIEQTRMALELGAQIQIVSSVLHSNNIKVVSVSNGFAIIPTAEQMCNWLRKEKNIFFTPKKVGDNNYVLIGDLKHFQTYDSYEEAILAGIDIALEYLSNK